MKLVTLILTVFLFVVSSFAQSRAIDESEYQKAFQFAITETNHAYPHVFKVKIEIFENGKTIETQTETNENQAFGYSRTTKTTLAAGQTTNLYQLTVGFGKVFCSDDGKSWKPSRYECANGPLRIYTAKAAESVAYSVTEKAVKGEKFKVFRAYTVYTSSGDGSAKQFKEEISTIDSRGFFVNIIDIEGTLDPKTITLKREQTWMLKAKIKPIVAPK